MFQTYKWSKDEVLDLNMDLHYMKQQLNDLLERMEEVEYRPKQDDSKKDPYADLLADIRRAIEEQAKISGFFKIRLEFEHL